MPLLGLETGLRMSLDQQASQTYYTQHNTDYSTRYVSALEVINHKMFVDGTDSSDFTLVIYMDVGPIFAKSWEYVLLSVSCTPDW